MLSYALRALPCALRAWSRADGGLISTVHDRVWLSEIDGNWHMNQAAYPAALERGRMDWVLRSGAIRRWRSKGVTAMVAEQHIVYRRELKPFAPYRIDTRAVRVNGRLLAFEQHVLVGERVHARGRVLFIFVGPNGVLAAEAVSALCAPFLTEPLTVERWVAAEAAGA